MDDELSSLRRSIDDVDARLVALLAERARLAQQVGRVKEAAAAPVYRPEREAEVLRKVAAANAGPLPDAAVAAVFREVMSACRALERSIRVAYLGPPGTFSEQALRKQFGAAADAVPCLSIDEIFRCAEAGGAEFAIVPVENSTEGSITRTLDLLLATPLSIVAEVSLPISHHLLTRSGTMDGVVRIVAHAQSLAQCVNWLGTHHPSIACEPVASNGEAARLAAADASVAAIAGETAARRYDLQAVAGNIQDEPGNRTRFVVLGWQRTQPSGRDKTSLILAVPHRAGAVHHMLAPLAQHGVSMTRFESRPAKTGSWEYYFYVDVEGHEQEPKVALALGQLRAECAFYKSLGSYPVAD